MEPTTRPVRSQNPQSHPAHVDSRQPVIAAVSHLAATGQLSGQGKWPAPTDSDGWSFVLNQCLAGVRSAPLIPKILEGLDPKATMLRIRLPDSAPALPQLAALNTLMAWVSKPSSCVKSLGIMDSQPRLQDALYQYGAPREFPAHLSTLGLTGCDASQAGEIAKLIRDFPFVTTLVIRSFAGRKLDLRTVPMGDRKTLTIIFREAPSLRSAKLPAHATLYIDRERFGAKTYDSPHHMVSGALYRTGVIGGTDAPRNNDFPDDDVRRLPAEFDRDEIQFRPPKCRHYAMDFLYKQLCRGRAGALKAGHWHERPLDNPVAVATETLFRLALTRCEHNWLVNAKSFATMLHQQIEVLRNDAEQSALFLVTVPKHAMAYALDSRDGQIRFRWYDWNSPGSTDAVRLDPDKVKSPEDIPDLFGVCTRTLRACVENPEDPIFHVAQMPVSVLAQLEWSTELELAIAWEALPSPQRQIKRIGPQGNAADLYPSYIWLAAKAGFHQEVRAFLERLRTDPTTTADLWMGVPSKELLDTYEDLDEEHWLDYPLRYGDVALLELYFDAVLGADYLGADDKVRIICCSSLSEGLTCFLTNPRAMAEFARLVLVRHAETLDSNMKLRLLRGDTGKSSLAWAMKFTYSGLDTDALLTDLALVSTVLAAPRQGAARFDLESRVALFGDVNPDKTRGGTPELLLSALVAEYANMVAPVVDAEQRQSWNDLIQSNADQFHAPYLSQLLIPATVLPGDPAIGDPQWRAPDYVPDPVPEPAKIPDFKDSPSVLDHGDTLDSPFDSIDDTLAGGKRPANPAWETPQAKRRREGDPPDGGPMV